MSDTAADWRNINLPGAPASIAPSELLVPSEAPTESPIDAYYKRAREAIVLSSDERFQPDSLFARVVLLGVVASAENYFREVLAGVVQVCPECRRSSHKRMLSLAGIDYFGERYIGLALLEGVSLSGKAEVMKYTKELTGFCVPDNSDVSAALLEYDKVCQLRHAAAHSHGELCAQNLRVLEIPITARLRLSLDALRFQSIVAVCHTAVRTFNRWLFEKIGIRLACQGLLKGRWESDQVLYGRVFGMFCAVFDNQSAPDAQYSYTAFLPTLKEIVQDQPRKRSGG